MISHPPQINLSRVIDKWHRDRLHKVHLRVGKRVLFRLARIFWLCWAKMADAPWRWRRPTSRCISPLTFPLPSEPQAGHPYFSPESFYPVDRKDLWDPFMPSSVAHGSNIISLFLFYIIFGNGDLRWKNVCIKQFSQVFVFSFSLFSIADKSSRDRY